MVAQLWRTTTKRALIGAIGAAIARSPMWADHVGIITFQVWRESFHLGGKAAAAWKDTFGSGGAAAELPLDRPGVCVIRGGAVDAVGLWKRSLADRHGRGGAGAEQLQLYVSITANGAQSTFQ